MVVVVVGFAVWAWQGLVLYKVWAPEGWWGVAMEGLRRNRVWPGRRCEHGAAVLLRGP